MSVKKMMAAGLVFGSLAALTVGCAPKQPAENAAPEQAAAPAEVSEHPANCTCGEHAAEVPEVYKNVRPVPFADLSEANYTPDGMAVDHEREVLWLNVPNFGRMDNMKKTNSEQGGYLLSLTKDGQWTKELTYPVLEKTGQTGPMGMEFGPDGNLYVCDNQAFHDPNNGTSRILRVVMADGKPTGEVQTVVEGTNLANGIRWFNNKMFYTDSSLPFDAADDVIGAGGVFMFDGSEVLTAGMGENAPVKVTANKDDSHCLAYQLVYKLGRGDNTGCDGITVSDDGTVWFGNFGNGMMYAAYPDENGNYSRENVVCVFDSRTQTPAESGPYKGLRFECCDGIFYDKGLGLVIIDDSQNNALWAFAPVAKGNQITPKTIWKNGDTDGIDGSLDQPAEAIVFGDKLIVVAFDWPFPGLLNTLSEGPGTLSAINVSAIADLWKEIGGAAPAAEAPAAEAVPAEAPAAEAAPAEAPAAEAAPAEAPAN